MPKEEAEARFREYVEAYEVLSDPGTCERRRGLLSALSSMRHAETRARYDRGEDVSMPQQSQQHGYGGPFHFHTHAGHFHFRWG